MKKFIFMSILLITIFSIMSVPGYAAESGYVKADVLNVRSQGIVNENSIIIGTLTYGDKVTIIGEENGWYKIVYNEMAAFVKKDYIVADTESFSPDYQGQPIYTKGDQLLDIADQYLGTPYVYGGSKPGGFDCSGFTMYCYKQMGVSLYRTANDQQKNGVPVSRENLMPGDLVFFGSGNYASHVGIYVGNNTMIHSPRTGKTIEYTSIASSWYTSRYIGARRIF